MAISRNGVISHVGLVLGHGHTHWNDSMHIETFHAMVWDAANNQPQDVYYRDDYSNQAGSFEVDATPEVLAAYAVYVAKVQAEYQAYMAKVERKRIDTGKFVTVVSGRKIAKGTRGLVFWVGNNGYGPSAGIITATGEKHFTACSNLEETSISPEEQEAIQTKQAESKAKWIASTPHHPHPKNAGYKARQYKNYAALRNRI